MPKVSVLMPVYNTRPNHLREAIDSILAQTFTDFEFLILNDCSTDPQVEETVMSYSDPRIVYTVNERNLGISGSRNRLLDMAQGEYLAVMDHDDISMPDRFEKQVAFLDAHPETGVVGSQHKEMAKSEASSHPTDDISIKKTLMRYCCLCHSSLMIRASVLKKHNIRYEAMFSPAEDYALFGRLIPVTQFCNLQDVLFHYRSWQGNTSHKQAKKMTDAANGVRAFMSRDNQDLWAMAYDDLKSVKRYKVCGLKVLTKESTKLKTRWKLFGVLPIVSIREFLISNSDSE